MKNAQLNFFAILITATIGVLLLATLLFPQVISVTRAQPDSDTYVRSNASQNQTATLQYKPVVSIVSIGNGTLTLPVTTNYTVDLTAGTVVFLDESAPATTYTITYTYTASNYLDNSAERTLFAVVIIAGIVGFLYFLFRSFGLI